MYLLSLLPRLGAVRAIYLYKHAYFIARLIFLYSIIIISYHLRSEVMTRALQLTTNPHTPLLENQLALGKLTEY